MRLDRLLRETRAEGMLRPVGIDPLKFHDVSGRSSSTPLQVEEPGPSRFPSSRASPGNCLRNPSLPSTATSTSYPPRSGASAADAAQAIADAHLVVAAARLAIAPSEG